MWGVGSILAAILVCMGAIIATKSGMVRTGAGALILVVANTQGVCSGWVTICFVFLGLALSWVASHVYA